MIAYKRLFGISLLIFVSVFQSLSAQSDMRVVVAGLNQDVTLLAQQVKALRLEIEAMQRENTRLRSEVASARSQDQSAAQINSLSAGMENLRREFLAADDAQKKQIISEVSKQIDALSKEMQSGLNVVANAVNSQPTISAPVRFSDDYPQTGRPYVVQSGDTLSGIARKLGSTVKFIQNANKIVDPARDLRVGETIFIPIAE
jgi:LysM repeat protein